MKKKQILLSLVLWLAFNGFAALLRFGSQTMGLFPHPAVNTVTAILLPVGAGLLFSRWLPLSAFLPCQKQPPCASTSSVSWRNA
jgi:hypothetical protein